MILLIDNYDSFTYNIFQYIKYLNYDVIVKLNDEIGLNEIEELAPSHIIISPGPGGPESAGISTDIINRFKGIIPILGVCLGHQCIGKVFGGEIIQAEKIFHGKISNIYHDGRGVFKNLTNPVKMIRYHSLIIKKESLENEIEISAWTEDGTIMGIRHKNYTLEGVQFHPESYGSSQGYELLSNFLDNSPDESFLKRGLRNVYNGETLSEGDSERIMDEISRSDTSKAQIAGLLTALAIKGESVSEITGFAKVMRRNATKIKKPSGVKVIDLCGTGGDSSGTFNISTTAAFIAAGAGVTVAKHGNRSVTSRCGSADLCEAVGIHLNPDKKCMEELLKDIGISFLFAPRLHRSLKHIGSVRRELGFRTLFNILGPLSNPADADAQIIGVFKKDLVEKIAKVLVNLEVKRALIVHGSDGLDEITLTGKTYVAEVKDRWIKNYQIYPDEFGLQFCQPEDLIGGDLKTNSEIFLSILEGKRGPKRDIAVLNGAAAIYLSGIAGSLKDGVKLAQNSIDNGSARRKLDDLIHQANNF